MHQSSNESHPPAAAAAETPSSSSSATASVETVPDTQSSGSLASGGSKSSEAPADYEDMREAASTSATEALAIEERKER